MKGLRKTVKKEISNHYINYLFDEYEILDEKRPILKEAIYRVCESENDELDIADLNIKELGIHLVKNSRGHGDIMVRSEDYDCLKIESIIKYFANIILESENIPIDNFNLFLLGEKIKKLEKRINAVASNFNSFG